MISQRCAHTIVVFYTLLVNVKYKQYSEPDNSDLHSRQRSANTALHPLPLKRIGQGHPYLCHTIPGHKQAILISIPHKKCEEPFQ